MTLEQFTMSNTDLMKQFRRQYREKNKSQSVHDWADEFEAWQAKR